MTKGLAFAIAVNLTAFFANMFFVVARGSLWNAVTAAIVLVPLWLNWKTYQRNQNSWHKRWPAIFD